jgi:hypothetical protein
VFSHFQKTHGASHDPRRHLDRKTFLQAILGDDAVVIVAELFLEFIDSFDRARRAPARDGLS